MPVLKRFASKRLLRIMRGYRRLKAENRLSCIVELKEALTNAQLNFVAEQADARIFGAGQKDAEIIIRQYLLVRAAGLNLNKALLASLGGGGAVACPLPAPWQKIVREHGFAVAGFRCSVLWYAYVALLGVYGLWLLLGAIFTGLKESVRPSWTLLGRYAYFFSLVPGNLPQPGEDGRSHDIMSWYLQWPERNLNLDTLAHGVQSLPTGNMQGVRVVPLPQQLPPLLGVKCILHFLTWGLLAAAMALLDLLRGRWWHALILGESVRAEQVRQCDPSHLARDYLFHNSGHIYRPLWTYEAENYGSRILFYFYSTNCESIKTRFGYPIQANSWQAMSWPHYLVWNEGQAEFVRRAVGQGANIDVVGPIWFHSSSVQMPSLPQRTIAVFDVQPVRPAFYRTLGLALDYYIPQTANRFLSDIYESGRKCGVKVALKRKRKIGRLAHPSYSRFVESLDGSSDFIAIDPDISAVRVIEQSTAVISMAFTSTALIARELARPSCYYDPTGIIQKDDRAAHGIEIISGREELDRWLRSMVGEEGRCNLMEAEDTTEKMPEMANELPDFPNTKRSLVG